MVGPRKRPPSTTVPPRVVPWPPTNLVSEWTTTSAPYSSGLRMSGVATVLSTMRGTPWRMGYGSHGLEVDDVAGRVADGLAEDGPGVLVDERGDRLGPVVGGETRLDARVGRTWAK